MTASIPNRKLRFDCPACQALQDIEAGASAIKVDFPCSYCSTQIHIDHLNQEQVDICCICHEPKLYQHKDFNKALGFAVFAAGAVLVPWTYSISLLVALGIDAALYPFFPWMQVCYKCKTEHRGWPKHPEWDRFNHEIAAHYEYRKN